MLPPLSTRLLLASFEAQRRADAARRWRLGMRPVAPASAPARRDIPIARPLRP